MDIKTIFIFIKNYYKKNRVKIFYLFNKFLFLNIHYSDKSIIKL